MLVLGVDPGTTLHGWALLKVEKLPRGSTRARTSGGMGWLYVSSGHATTQEMCDRVAVLELEREAAPEGDALGLVAMEWAKDIFTFDDLARTRAVGAALMRTQGEANFILGRASAKTPIQRIEATEWRRGIVGARSPSDAVVRSAILRWVHGWPASSAAGEHACDAAGVAMAAYNNHMARLLAQTATRKKGA